MLLMAIIYYRFRHFFPNLAVKYIFDTVQVALDPSLYDIHVLCGIFVLSIKIPIT